MADIVREEEIFGPAAVGDEKSASVTAPSVADVPPTAVAPIGAEPADESEFFRSTLLPLVRQGGQVSLGLPGVIHAPLEAARRAFAPEQIQPDPQGRVSDEQLAEYAVREQFGIPQGSRTWGQRGGC